MSRCYKCGIELPGLENECEPGECHRLLTEADWKAEEEAEDESKWVQIDWDKVTTLEQLKLIIRCTNNPIIHVDDLDDPELQPVKHLFKAKKP